MQAVIAGAATVVLAVGLLAVVYRVLRSAHARPQAIASPHAPDGASRSHTASSRPHSRPEAAVLGVVGRIIELLLRLGVRLGPAMLLTVRGRTTGLPRTNPVDLFERDGRRWLVATHQANASWVRNLRAAGEGTLTRGRRRQTFTAVELPQREAAFVLKEVLGPRLAKPVGGLVLRQTLGVPPRASMEQFISAAALHPVFELAVSRDLQEGAAAQGRLAPQAAIVAGALIALVHLTLGATGIMTGAQWISGLVIGLVVVGIGNHARIFGRG